MSFSGAATAETQKPADRLLELFSLFSKEAPEIMEQFVEEFAPSLEFLREQLSDLSHYQAPEILPNGDIIIRRKPDAPKLEVEPPKADDQIEL